MSRTPRPLPPRTPREGLTDSVYLESAADVSLYTKAFDHLRALALSPDRSASFMHAILKEHSR
ncbi:Scr1 family TA system antitoxin-like transcriptional regulator [Streptomyces laculatispora]|uniref:Scr1 family TA system antitoxin-like transcriptional regulator n=1 Tax=Streptomyces laculatispora TaxID=887464 RepID=UPI003514BF62